VGDFASFAKFFAGFYFGRGIDLYKVDKKISNAVQISSLPNKILH
jgi:hypothetical protein